MSTPDCRHYLTCTDCIASSCTWVVDGDNKLTSCFSHFSEAYFSISGFKEPGDICPPESTMYYLNKSGFQIWGPILITILLLLGFHFIGRRVFLARSAQFLTRCERTEATQPKKNTPPGSGASLSNKQIREDSKFVTSKFFERAAPSDRLEKVETFNFQLLESPAVGALTLEFDLDRMIAYLSDGTVKRWNWGDDIETTMRFGIKLNGITSFQYDEEIIVLGTAAGTVHLLDAITFEEKWSIRFGDPVGSIKFVESTLVILTRGVGVNQFWWVKISRSDMKMLNRRLVVEHFKFSLLPNRAGWLFPFLAGSKSESVGFLIDTERCFVYQHSLISVRNANSGDCITDESGHGIWLLAPADISALYAATFFSTNRIIVAGCKNGTIAMWNTDELTSLGQLPFKILKGHTGAVRSLCALNGHLLSVDQSGKLFMWSGYDLENNHVKAPVPRVLAQNFLNVSCLAGNERWFASSSSENGIINIWALPELWIRTG